MLSRFGGQMLKSMQIPSKSSFLCHGGGLRACPVTGLSPGRRRNGGFTFAEVLIAILIVVIVFGATIQGYLVTATRCQWTAYSLAAQSLGLQTIEQARSGTWDIASGNNQLTNLNVINPMYVSGTMTFTGYTTSILDVPWKGTNAVVATNWVSIRWLYENGNSAQQVQLALIRMDTVWPFSAWGNHTVRYYTNTICSYMAPDNRDPKTLGCTPPPGT